MSIFDVALESFIDMNHELVLLSKQVDWAEVESELAEYYCADNGRPSVPVRKMVDMTKFRKRAGIEPVIGHLKSDHRMMRNYLKGTLGDVINTMMAAAAYHMRHWMNKNALSSFVSWLKTLFGCLENVIFGNENNSVCLCSALAVVAWRGVWQT